MLVCVCGLLTALLEGGPLPTSVPPTITSLPLVNTEKSCPICTSICSGSLPVIVPMVTASKAILLLDYYVLNAGAELAGNCYHRHAVNRSQSRNENL